MFPTGDQMQQWLAMSPVYEWQSGWLYMEIKYASYKIKSYVLTNFLFFLAILE